MILSMVLFVSVLTYAQAAVDSTFVVSIGDFVSNIFGQAAGETVMSVIFKVIGVLAALDWVIMLLLTFIPTTSPARSFMEKLLVWIRSIVGDKKKGGGTFDKN